MLLYEIIQIMNVQYIYLMIDQRFYNSASTNRSIMQMGPIPLRSHTDNIYKEQQKQLEKSLSRQSYELSKSKKNLHKQSSQRYDEPENRKKPRPKNTEVNQVMEAYAQGRIQDIQDENICINKFQFKFLSYLGEIVLAYGITIGLMYASKSTQFPFFLLLFTFGLMMSIMPWAKTNIMIIISCAVIIANFYLQIQVLTLPIIMIFYFSVLIFNEHNKIKLLFIPVIVITMVWGFIVIPSLYAQFVRLQKPSEFYYVFPLFMYMIRVFLYMVYRQIQYTEYIFLQLPFFLTGLEFGVMMTLDVHQIQFWYLMVFFTLLIINDRTQFTINILVNLWKALSAIGDRKQKRSRNKKKQQNLSSVQLDESKLDEDKNVQRDVTILASHASGYSSIHFIHLVCMVYVFTMLPITATPYKKGTFLSVYVLNKSYLPVVIWALGIVYEFMCLVLERKRRDKLLIGFSNNGIFHTIQRGFMLSVGMWMLYVGLGVGNYAISTKA